jgi:hypothetical protein
MHFFAFFVCFLNTLFYICDKFSFNIYIHTFNNLTNYEQNGIG